MRNRPWLQKEDRVWVQLVNWTTARELILNTSYGYGPAKQIARDCPDIEEARWFLTITLPSFEPDKTIISKAFVANSRDLRSLTYAAIIARDYPSLRQCALNGNPMAQVYACRSKIIRQEYPEFKEDSEQFWIEKSMEGGYSEAFCHADNQDANKRLDYLFTGIQHGSIECMVSYGLDSSNPLDKIYWVGRAWLLQTELNDKSRDFEILCYQWYEKFKANRDYISEAFVIASIANRSARRIFDGMLNQILEATKAIHKRMLDTTRNAVISWVIVARRLGICKDVSRIIAKLVWWSRDQSDWEVRRPN